METEFRFGEKIYYRFTPEGRKVAGWTRPNPLEKTSSNSGNDIGHAPSLHEETKSKNQDSRLVAKASLIEKLRKDYNDGRGEGKVVVDDNHQIKDSHTSKLKQILEDPTLRALFREFLRANFCEENLSFWLDVQDFKRKFNMTSSAIASPLVQAKEKEKENKKTPLLQGTTTTNPSERHQQDLIGMAFVIYNSRSTSGLMGIFFKNTFEIG